MQAINNVFDTINALKCCSLFSLNKFYALNIVWSLFMQFVSNELPMWMALNISKMFGLSPQYFLITISLTMFNSFYFQWNGMEEKNQRNSNIRDSQTGKIFVANWILVTNSRVVECRRHIIRASHTRHIH